MHTLFATYQPEYCQAKDFHIPDIYIDEYGRNVKQRDFLHKPLLCGFGQDGSKTASSRGKMIRIRKLELLPVTYFGSSLTASLIFLLF